MDIRERHLGSISNRTADGLSAEVDVGLLIRRLLLFEHCTLESDLLREIPHLVRIFGVGGVEALLKSKSLSIVCDAATMGSVGQNAQLKNSITRGGPLPLGSYCIASVTIADREKYLHDALQSVHDAPGMKLKQQIKLKKQLVPLLEAHPREMAREARNAFMKTVQRSDPVIRSALEVTFRAEKGVDLPNDVDVHIERLDDDDFRASTNLASRCSLSDQEAHKIMERALLGAAGLELSLQKMKTYNSLSGFRDSELPIFEQRVSWLEQQLDPAAQERRFDRVVEIAGLPGLDNLPSGQRIDVERLLKLRDSEECRDFRRWLRGVSSETDREIEARFASLHEKVAQLTHTKTAKIFRFVVEAGTGLIPMVGSVWELALV